MMTTLAAMLGALPLAIMTGQSSEMRRPLGLAIVGGLFISQILTLYTTPVVYIYPDGLRRLYFVPSMNRKSALPHRLPQVRPDTFCRGSPDPFFEQPGRELKSDGYLSKYNPAIRPYFEASCSHPSGA